ncbi:hypothetical protein SAMN05216388_10453 [Halorientalis persicus]|uniref:Sulfatase n=1 Tax=Halorientalis persicus TaxID=1367881 RepID=A0A1H8W021_9EURY|nr:hypothetical protein [Halorientalis persicus]SEP20867.1 hypothetical protein SAMN05216388_10453 [Halorientalis persicus]
MDKRKLLREIYATYLLFWLLITSRWPIGTNVFEREWDVLIVLDACRVDALRQVQSEYDFLYNIEEVWSIGSTSKEWIEQTFTKRNENITRNTAYITGNPFSNTLIGERGRLEYGATHNTWIEKVGWADKLIKNRLVDPENIGHIEPLWGDPEEHNRFESQKPPSITNHTIQAARGGEYDRIIAHYMQPHSPYYSTTTEYENLEEYELHPFKALRGEKYQNEKVWDAYIDNLRYALDSIEKLLDNIDGKVVITADHGELLGDQGMYYHMPGNPHPKLKKVPWVQIESTDNRSIDPDVSLSGRESAQDISEDQLEALGYL